MDWTEYWYLLDVLLLIPFALWACVLFALYLWARSGRIEVSTNLLAISGAFLGLCSALAGWSMIERGYDWEALTPLFIWLFFTYPLTFITPVAGVGNAVVLTGALLLVNQKGAEIEPMFGYMLGWVSVVILFTSIAVPVGARYEGRWVIAFGSRFLTLTYRTRIEPVRDRKREATALTPRDAMIPGGTDHPLKPDQAQTSRLRPD